MILFCFISLLGTASAEEIIDNNIASNDASIDIDVIESPIHEDISISTVKNSDVSADDSSTVNGSASKGKLTANKLSADHTFIGSTFDELQSFLNSGNINDGDTVYLGGIDLTSSWASYQHNFIDVNINNLKIMGGTSSNPNAFSTLNGNGACIFRLSGSGITLNNINFVNAGHNGDKGSAVNVQNSGCTINNCAFTNCKSTGGALYSSSAASNLKVNDCNFTNNVADWSTSGGAMYLDGPNTEISNCNFDSNSGGSYAGIFSDGDLKVTNSNFTNNGPGVIYSGSDIEIANSNFVGTTGNSVAVISGGSTNVENSNFTNNAGGAIYSSINTEITNSNFVNNNGGTFNNVNVGAVYSGGTTTVRSSKFERNTAPNNEYGGINSRGVTTVTDSNFTENSGGAIHSYSDGEITNCIIENHSSQNAAVNIYGTAIVSNSNFTNNSNTGWSSGGALYANGANSQITDCNFENNKARNAGAIYLSGESTKVENCNFTNNNATDAYGQAGAIDVVGSNAQVINSNFKGNNADGGGAIYVSASGLTLRDSTFEENLATHGGAINIYHDDASITNCNFTDNAASQQGGAVYIGADCYNADMTECNFTGNTAGTGTAIYAADGANGKVTDCEFGVKPELNVNNGYPVLTLTLESDYNNIIVGDIEGGPSGGSTVPEANETITLEIFDSEGTLVATVTNKTDEKGQMKYDYSHLPRGNYTYKATYMDGQTKEGPLSMGVVEGDNFSAIQAAINAAEPGSVLFLEGKTYYNDIQGTMTINKPITIIGTDGTVLDAENISRIFTIADNTDNVNLNNITFINGFVEDGDGGAIYVSQGSDNLNLVNCNFTNNHATGEDSQGGALFIAGGANNGNIINTTFDNNTADIDGGAIRNDGGWGWNIYNTSFTNNSAVIDGDSDAIQWGGGAIWTCNAPMTIYNSNFTENNGTYGGAIRGAVSTYECLFDNNTATNGNGGAIDVTTDSGLYDQIDLEFVNTTFVNNDAKGSRGQDRAQGGGIHIYHLKEIDMYGCYCENNTADRGGAIDFYELERTFVENCTILNNNATSEGGGMAIFCNRSIFTDTNVSNNNAGTDGGAIWVIGHNALFDNITSINNTAERGGSSFIEGNDIVIVDCNITNNTAVFNPSKPDDSGLGGAIDVIGDNCRIINLTSEDNNAYRGGSTYIRGDNTLVYNSTFDNNNATLRGGGLNIAGSGCVFENVSISNCNAYGDGDEDGGGAVYVVGDDNRFTNVTTVNNTAISYGGSSYIGGSNNLIENCTVSNNSAYNGGGIFIMGDDSKFTGNNITYNNAIATDEDHEMNIQGGGVFILGEGSNFTNNNISSNHAKDNGGGVTVFFGPDTYFEDIYAFNNTAENGGFSNLQFCDGLTIKNSTFYSNHATGDISLDRGEGGAFHIFQSDNIDIQGNFSYNTATNGSAIYVEESTMYVHDTTFFDNQAHSYYLLVTPEENTTYNKNENVTVSISLIGGDNVANAIHNREAGSDITLRNLTYPFYNDGVLENRTFSPNEDVSPVIGYENSDNGNLIYLDDLEDNQVIYYEIFNKDTGQSVINFTNNRSDISGSVTLTLSDLEVGNYTVRAHYYETTYYTEIANETVFRVVDTLANMTVNKTSLNSTDFVLINDTVGFNITVNNTGDINLYGVNVTEIFNSTELEYINHSNNQTWIKIGDSFIFNGTKQIGDLIAYTIYLRNNGDCILDNITISNVYDPTELKYVKGFDYENTAIIDNNFFLNITLGAGSETSFTLWFKTLKDDFKNMTPSVTYDIVEEVPGTEYNPSISIEKTLEDVMAPLHVNETSTFTIWFKVLTNGTLVNNVTAKSNETNETNDTANVTVYKPNMTVQKIANDNITYVGNTTSFTIVVTNTGDCNLSDVVVTDTDFSKGLVYDHYTNSSRQWTYDGNGHWTLVNPLLNGTSANFTVFFNVTVNGTLVNNVSAVSNLTNETNGTNQTRAYLPNMTVQKIANDEVVYVGNQTSFTIVVTNTGDCNLSDVVVTDTDFTQGLVYDHYTNSSRQWTYDGRGHWTLVNGLENGTSANFTVFFNVTVNGTLVNNVSAKSNLTNETNGTNQTRAYLPNMTVQKIANDNVTYVGNTTSFTIVVTNTGDCNLSEIVVTDDKFSSGLIYKNYQNGTGYWNKLGDKYTLVGDLAPGASASFTVFFDVIDNGTLVNNVSAVSNLTNETNGTNNTTAYRPNMTVQKIANDDLVYVGNTTSFTIVVTNTGDCNLSSVVVTDKDFSTGLRYKDYTNGSRQWTYDGDGHWTLDGILTNGSSANFTVIFDVISNGTLVNNVSAKSNLTNETNGTNNTTAKAPNMTVQKISLDKIVPVGTSARFEIVVTNTGDCELSDVYVIDTDHDEGLVYLKYENGTRNWNNDVDGRWDLVGTLGIGQNASFIIYFNVTANGTLTNNVTAGSNLTNETNGTNSTISLVPNMTVQKIANDNITYIGNVTSFTIVVRNTGEANLTNIIVSDTDYSEGLVFNGTFEPIRGEWAAAGDRTWSLAFLEVGDYASFTLYFNVTANGTLVNNVSAHSDLTNETNGTNETKAYAPNMTVQKIANDDVVYVGNTTSFTIVVTNTGDCNLSDVVVTDKQFSSGLVYKDYTNGTRNWNYDSAGKWTLDGVLTNGSSASFTVVFDVIDNGTLVNNVSASSNLTNETNGTNNTTAYRPNMTVQKIANDDLVYVGNITSFTIVVTNTGDCNLSDVVVTDDKFSSGLVYKDYTNGTRNWNYDGDGHWTLDGVLTNGSSASFTVFFVVISNGTLVNNVSASSNLTNETNGTNNTTSKAPNMTVQKIANDDVVYVGNTTSFDIVVTNTGDCNLSDVVVTDDKFSSGLRYKEYTNGTGSWNFDESSMTWTLVGSLENGTSASFTVVFDVIDNGTLVNNVSASSNLTNETNGTNNTTAYRPNMTVQKIANDDVVYVGNITSFTIVVTNTGDCNLSDVVVTDKQFSSGLRYKDYTNGSRQWTYDGAGKWTLDGVLTNGSSASFTVIFDVIDNGTLVNNVSASSNLTNETNGTNNTTSYRPNMTVQKIANDDLVYVGNITSFTIIVTNTGDCNLSEIVVTDKDFSSGLRYKEYTNGTGRWNYNEANKTWTLVGSLENGTSADFTVFFEVISNGTLVNNVSASSNLTNETNGTNNTTAKAPNMTVQKISIDKVVPVGNTSRFEILVTNTGDCELSDIYVIDTDHDEGLVYLKYENGTRTWNYDGNGRWDLVGPLGIDQSASFIIYFNVTANGTLRNNVTAGSNLTNETNGTNETTSLVPNMTIEKIANQKVIYVGNTTSFTIIVRNTGEANLTNILVTDKDYSEGLVFNGVYEPIKGDWTYNGDNTWSLASLNVGEDASFTLYFNVTANGTLVNNASAHSDLTNETNATNDTRAYQPNMTVKKLIYDDVVYVGDLAIFTIMVYNTGDCNLSNVTVKETWFSEGLVFDDWVPNGNYLWDFNEDEMTWTMKGILPPFENNIASFVVYFNVTQNGTLKNNVSASSNLTNETNSSNETHAYDPKLTVEKISNDDVVYVGNTTSFTIVVRNTGDCELSEIVVTDDKYSDGLEYSKYENGSRLWNYVDGKWNLVGSLAPGETADFTVFFTVISNGTLNNTASAVSNLTNETNSTNNTTAYKPDITVIKIANDDVVYVGNVTSFTILVINTGDCDLSGIYVIDDDYSDGLKFNRYENGTGKWTYDGERFTLVGDLAAGESADFTVFFDVVENGTLVNNVSAGSNLTNETNNTNNTTAKPVCDVIIYKEVNTTECLVGDLVEWTITVVNVGPSTALDVIVKDVLSKDLELVSASSTSYNNATGEWTVGDLKVNTPVSLTLVTRVLASGTIYNNATVNTTTDESNYTNNNASNKTDAKVLCDLVITKAVNQSSCNVSDIIQWNVTVTNLGPHSASDVIVKDLLPDGLELISYNVSIGNFNDVIGEWSVGTLDKDQIESLILVTKVLVNGTIVNIATVNTTTPDLDYTNNEANNTTVAENICDLEVIKIVNSKKVYIGDLLTWTIRVTNNGPSEALDVCVSDILPEGLIFVNYRATTGKYDDVSGTWTVGKLASGSSATLDLITRIDELGNITNPVSVNTTTPESNYSNNKANNTTEAIPIVDLVLDKSSDKAKYNVNDTMHWIIKVTNRGPCDAIDAYVLDVLPKGTKFISYEATKGTYDETTGVWSIGDIANGEEVSIDILCKALLSGNFTNNATVYNNVTDTNTSNNYDNSTVEIIEDTPEPGPNPNPEPVPDEPIPNEPPVTMLKTGNPLVVLLLALIAMAGTLGLRRRKE